MSPEPGGAAREPGRAPQLRYRVAFFLTGLVVLSIVVTLPFSLKSVVDDLFGPDTGRVVKLTRGRPDTARPNHTKLHLAFVSINESALVMNIRVSGHHRCVECDWNERVLFALNVQEYASHAAFGRRLASGPFSTPYLARSFLNA
jgi:hypothetical protein